MPATSSDDTARLISALEVLSDLIFLTSQDAEVPDKVRSYMRVAEAQFEIVQGIALRTAEDTKPTTRCNG